MNLIIKVLFLLIFVMVVMLNHCKSGLVSCNWFVDANYVVFLFVVKVLFLVYTALKLCTGKDFRKSMITKNTNRSYL